jgi:membrane-bound lytic murein transglycosylase A
MVIRKNFCCIIFFSALLINACAHKDSLKLQKVSFAQLDNWPKENYLEAVKAFAKSCKSYDKKNWQRFLYNQDIVFNANEYDKYCKLSQQDFLSNKDAKIFFEDNFSPYLIKNNNQKTGLFTGYYEPIIHVASAPSKKYKYPIYAKPHNLDKIIPYFSRKQIEFGAIKNNNLEIAYTNDLVELFFLHIQGSGIIKYKNGLMQRLSYDGKNGHKYFSIGKYFLEKKYDFSEINADFIKAELKKDEKIATDIMHLNPSYVFFKINNNNYAIGGQGTELTAERSIAIDKTYLPYGALFWLSLENNNDNPYKDFNRLVVSQDNGAAIKGVIRADIFFGSEGKAKFYASHMKAKGEYYILLPKSY